MALDVTADIAEMLADFGVTVTTSGASTFTGIFVDEYEAQTLYDMDIDSSSPLLTCRTADVSNLSRTNTLTIGGVSYKVISVQPDNTGVTVVALSKDTQ